MSLKIFTISTIYPGNLGSFYERFPDYKSLSYSELYQKFLDDTTEFVGSYTRTLIKLGIDAKFVIANDEILQQKWDRENLNKNRRNILLEQVKNQKPDILWIENLNFTDKSWLENIRKNVPTIKLVIAYHCSPFNSKIIERLKYVDFLITCTPGLRQDMENLGIKSYLVYHGFDSSLLSRINSENLLPHNNLVFSGSLSPGAGLHGSRIELIESIIKADIDIALYVNLENKYKILAKQSLYIANKFLRTVRLEGLMNNIKILQYGKTPIKNYSGSLLREKQVPVYGLDMYRLFSNSKVVLNIHIGAVGNYAGNMRLFEVTGVGSCLLTDSKINLTDLFSINSEIVVYENKDDLIDKAKWLLGNEEERKNIALAGQQKTLATHTVDKRCRQILDIIENELNSKKQSN